MTGVTGAPTGIASAADMADDFAQTAFMIHQILNQIATCAIVKVVAVTAGGVGPVGKVDLQPLVLQVDGVGRTVDAGTIHNAPYMRMQGGANAFICDPVAGDIGLCIFTSHDSSKVKTTKTTAPPGSRRRFSWSDGFYVGGVLNGTPQNYIQFDTNGDIILKPASKVTVLGDFVANKITTAAGVDLDSHIHSGVQSGGSNTGEPVP